MLKFINVSISLNKLNDTLEEIQNSWHVCGWSQKSPRWINTIKTICIVRYHRSELRNVCTGRLFFCYIGLLTQTFCAQVTPINPCLYNWCYLTTLYMFLYILI